jgi:hypothetical protein
MTPTLPRFLRAMPFVEVAMGLRAEPGLERPGIQALVGQL